MFYKKEIEHIKTLAHERYLWQKEKNIEYENAYNFLKEKIKETNDRINTVLRIIEGNDKYLQMITPTINKQVNKIKKLEENYQLLVKVVEKIVTKIDPEWKSKTVNINKAKKGK